VKVRVTTVWPDPLVVTLAARFTAAPPMRVSWNAAAALALPPVKLTGPEKVTTTSRTSDRWTAPSLACTDRTVGAAAPPVDALTANSEVLPRGSVAVAEMNSPAVVAPSGTLVNVALPEASVVTVVEPRYRWPSPLRLGSWAVLA
jgi:hypothetical protein